MNVPKGHGIYPLPFCVNPEVKRAEVYALPVLEDGSFM